MRRARRKLPAVRSFDDTTLWRISAFDRMRDETGTSGFAKLDGATVLPSTLLADLSRFDEPAHARDVLEVMAACMRNLSPALIYLGHEELVWPVTVFPTQMLYHSPRDMTQASRGGLADLRFIDVEPPGVRAPGHWMHERVAGAEQYRSLSDLLWLMALHGPRGTLLAEIGGVAAYRAVKDIESEGQLVTGAMGSAAIRLRRETVALRDIAGWPGMSVERASRLVNALYLTGGLLVTRTHPAARADPGAARRAFGLGKPRR